MKAFAGCEKTCANVSSCEHACPGYRERGGYECTVRVGDVVVRGNNLRETAARALQDHQENIFPHRRVDPVR